MNTYTVYAIINASFNKYYYACHSVMKNNISPQEIKRHLRDPGCCLIYRLCSWPHWRQLLGPIFSAHFSGASCC